MDAPVKSTFNTLHGLKARALTAKNGTKRYDIALLVMDMQAGILQKLPGPDQLIANLEKAIQAAREREIRVIYVTP